MDDVDRNVVAMDLGVGLTNVFVGVVVAGGVGFQARWWWVGVLGATCAGLLLAAADRSRAGLWALLVGGGLLVAGVGWALYADARGIVPIALVGIGAGATLNRLVFGVVRPVPPVRRRRQGST